MVLIWKSYTSASQKFEYREKEQEFPSQNLISSRGIARKRKCVKRFNVDRYGVHLKASK